MRRQETRQSSRKHVLLKSMHSRTRAAIRGALCDAKWRLSSNLGIPPPGLFRRASISLGFDGQSFQVASKTGYAQWWTIIQACERRLTGGAREPPIRGCQDALADYPVGFQTNPQSPVLSIGRLHALVMRLLRHQAHAARIDRRSRTLWIRLPTAAASMA
jgi:hypothetical protein